MDRPVVMMAMHRRAICGMHRAILATSWAAIFGTLCGIVMSLTAPLQQPHCLFVVRRDALVFPGSLAARTRYST
jgi:hypothetical protein